MNRCYKCGDITTGDNLQCDYCKYQAAIELPDEEDEEPLNDCPHCGWPNEVWRNRCVDCKRDLNEEV